MQDRIVQLSLDALPPRRRLPITGIKGEVTAHSRLIQISADRMPAQSAEKQATDATVSDERYCVIVAVLKMRAYGAFNSLLRVDSPFPAPRRLIWEGKERVDSALELCWGQVTCGASFLFSERWFQK
jgi:hypothetical protein